MKKSEALKLFHDAFAEAELVSLAKGMGCYYGKSGAINKGWFGVLAELVLGKKPDSAQLPDFPEFEVKTNSFRNLKRGGVSQKEDIFMTMVVEDYFKETSFLDSHLFSKLKSMLLVIHVRGDSKASCLGIIDVSLNKRLDILLAVESEYNMLRDYLLSGGVLEKASRSVKTSYLRVATKGKNGKKRGRAFALKRAFLKDFYPERLQAF